MIESRFAPRGEAGTLARDVVALLETWPDFELSELHQFLGLGHREVSGELTVSVVRDRVRRCPEWPMLNIARVAAVADVEHRDLNEARRRRTIWRVGKPAPRLFDRRQACKIARETVLVSEKG